jgi:CRISPR-associated endonuclease/helicase Cas3
VHSAAEAEARDLGARSDVALQHSEQAQQLKAPSIPWAKLRRSDEESARRTGCAALGAVVAWRSLIDHCADVAAVFSAILDIPGVRERVANLSDLNTPGTLNCRRLAVLAALHDFGKANWGFRARWRAEAPSIGHVREAWMAVKQPQICARLVRVLPLRECAEWFGSGALAMAIGHHGTPLNPEADDPDDRALWTPRDGDDPVASLTPLGQAIRQWMPEAFDSSPAQPMNARAWSMISGLLTLADWIGSDERFFPLAPVDQSEIGVARFAQSSAAAGAILRRIGFDADVARRVLAPGVDFASISPHPPRPIQRAAAANDDAARIVVLESETGSGKTEAALFRFARLFAAGKVDGLYFALPTRVAATALHGRVEAAVARLWSNASERPAVTLAVPGQEMDRAPGLDPPAGGHDVWDNAPAGREDVWAASRPKKYLAGTIAVGTIDQALLAIIKVKHAHLRLACLTRHLLVVDEVHASDRYMETLLAALLRFHRRAGGHALLLSATLGAQAREKLLQRGEPPPLAQAIASPYPALSNDARPELIAQPWGDTPRTSR